MKNDNIEDLVRVMIAESVGRNPEAISLDNRLREDLHLDGDDAEELLNKLRKKLTIDFSGLNFGRHFAGETSVWFLGFVEYLERLFGRSKQRFVPVKVRDLVEAARSGVWIEK